MGLVDVGFIVSLEGKDFNFMLKLAFCVFNFT